MISPAPGQSTKMATRCCRPSRPIRCSAIYALRARRQHHDVHADRQLQIRPGACAGAARTAGAVNLAMNWSLSFEPLLSWPLLAVVLVPLLVLALVGLWFRQRGAIFRFAALAALGRGPAQPGAARRGARAAEERRRRGRRPQPEPGHRRPQAETTDAALAGLQQRLARFKQFDVRVVEAGRAEAADERTETRLFSALDSAFRDVPPSRIGGAVMITDGAGARRACRTRRLQRAAARADHRRRGREGSPHPLRKRAALRHCRQAAGDDLPRHRHRRRTRPGRRPRLDQRRAGLDRARHDRAGNAARSWSFRAPAATSSNSPSTRARANSPTPTTAPSP